MWPSRWFTPMKGTPSASATAFAAAIPTSSAPTSPGPTVTATASTSPTRISASFIARSIIGLMASTCAREATSGTTPPNRSCRCVWLETRFARTHRPSSTTATAVSSQEVSIPRTRTRLPSEISGRLGPGRNVLDDVLEALSVVGRPDVVGHHDESVFGRLLAVVLPDHDRAKPEPPVHALGGPVRDAHLERDGDGTHADAFLDQLVQEAGADLLPMVGGVDGDGRDVRLIAVAHQAPVPRDVPAELGDEVRAVARLVHLR